MPTVDNRQVDYQEPAATQSVGSGVQLKPFHATVQQALTEVSSFETPLDVLLWLLVNTKVPEAHGEIIAAVEGACNNCGRRDKFDPVADLLRAQQAIEDRKRAVPSL